MGYKYFIIRLEGANPDAMTPNIVQEHVAWLSQLDDQEILLECGPCGDGTALILLRCGSLDEAVKISNSDPFATHRAYENRTVVAFRRATKENNYLLS